MSAPIRDRADAAFSANRILGMAELICLAGEAARGRGDDEYAEALGSAGGEIFVHIEALRTWIAEGAKGASEGEVLPVTFPSSAPEPAAALSGALHQLLDPANCVLYLTGLAASSVDDRDAYEAMPHLLNVLHEKARAVRDGLDDLERLDAKARRDREAAA